MNAIALKYGGILFVGQLIFFFLLRAVGMTDNTVLILISAVFQLIIVYFAIRAYRLSGKSQVGNYLSGVMMGMYVIFTGALAFVIFINLYLNIDPSYSNALEDNAIEGNLPENKEDIQGFMNPLNMSAVLFGSAIVVGLIGSYILTRIIDMNLAHNNTNVNAGEQ